MIFLSTSLPATQRSPPSVRIEVSARLRRILLQLIITVVPVSPERSLSSEEGSNLLEADTRGVFQEDSIPKPKGSAGKPSHGGYSLQAALGWSTADYKAVQVRRVFP